MCCKISAKQPRGFLLIIFLLFLICSNRISAQFTQARINAISSQLSSGACIVVFAETDSTINPDFFYLAQENTSPAALAIFSSEVKYRDQKSNFFIFSDNILGHSLEKQALLPLQEWKNFCSEILADPNVKKIHILPSSGIGFESRKRQLEYTFYTSLGEPATLQAAQKLRSYLLRIPGEQWKAASPKVNAYLQYFPHLKQDALLLEAAKIQDQSELIRIQEELKKSKLETAWLRKQLDILQAVKSPAELRAIRSTATIATLAMQELIFAIDESPEVFLPEAIATFVVEGNGAFRLNKPSKTTSIKAVYVADIQIDSEGYVARLTRTLPPITGFQKQEIKAYKSVCNTHLKLRAALKQGVKPTEIVLKLAQEWENSLKKEKLWYRDCVRIVHCNPIGIKIQEPLSTATVSVNTTWLLETQLKYPSTENIPEPLRGKSFVIRDMLEVGGKETKILTGQIPVELSQLESMIKEKSSLIKVPAPSR